MLNVTEFIKNTPNWREVLSAPPYCVNITDDGGFTILKYSRTDSDFSLGIVRECRGLIIDGDYNAVCVPFFKFANYAEPYADKIDWKTARVEEKLDGSLIKVWCYKGEWIISTNGTIFAEKANISPHGGGSARFSDFAELFRAGADKAGLDITKLDPRCTYMFELCSPYNRIVVPHSDIKIYHIGTRDNGTLRELETDIGVEKPRTYKCGTLEELIETARALRYCEEGYVVKDADYRRVKVKSPAYVAAHNLVSDFSDKKLLELIRQNETDEFLTYFPEYRTHADALAAKISAFETAVNRVLDEQVTGRRFETRKDFALMAAKTPFAAFLFAYYDGKTKSPGEWLRGLTNEKILEVLGGDKLIRTL